MTLIKKFYKDLELKIYIKINNKKKLLFTKFKIVFFLLDCVKIVKDF